MRWLFYLLVFGLIISPAVAEKVTVTSNVEWVTANTIDTAIITAHVTDNAYIPINNTNVIFSVNTSPSGRAYGSLNGSPYPITVRTDSNGNATAIFKVFTVSGTANISATAASFSESNSTFVQIDHTTPASIQSLSYNTNGTVGSIQDILVTYQDINGNIVDNRRYPEYVTFSFVYVNESSRFWNETAVNFSNLSNTFQNNEYGLVSANLSLGTRQGETKVEINSPSTKGQTITIERLADGPPASIYMRWDPPTTHIPADNESKIVFTYTLYDEYGNGLNNRRIQINSSLGDWGPLVVTTIEGIAAAEYGPKDQENITTIFAYAEDNPEVNASVVVDFYDPIGTALFATLNPVTIPSLDARDTAHSIISALVVDQYGRGIPGQYVTFQLENLVYLPPEDEINITSPPYLETPYNTSYGSETDGSGFAYARFYPSAFTTNRSHPDFWDYIAANANIHVTSGIKSDDVTVYWKNYPFLSISLEPDREQFKQGETVNITLTAKGDGWALNPKPIDLVYCINRGNSMLGDQWWQDVKGTPQDKMVFLYNTSGALFSELNASWGDRAALVTFGSMDSTSQTPKVIGIDTSTSDDATYWATYYAKRNKSYDDYSTLDKGLGLSQDLPSILVLINNTTPYGDKKNENHVAIRYGLYKSINEIAMNGYRTSVKAIVVLSDSSWNDFGDPIAGDTYSTGDVHQSLGYFISEKDPASMPEGATQWTAFQSFYDKTNRTMSDNTSLKSDPRQNMALYAKDNNIKIFSIAYVEKGTSVPTALKDRFIALSSTTGGQYYLADSGEALEGILKNISRQLREEAGLNTTAVLNFTQISGLDDNNQSVTWSGDAAFSYEYAPNWSTCETKGDFRTATVYNSTCYNQSDDWHDDLKLEYNDIGTLKIGEYWNARFMLRAKVNGTLVYLGNGSEVTFIQEGETEQVTVPEAISRVAFTALGDKPSQVLSITHYDVAPESLNSVFDITYSGEKPVHVRLFYRKVGSSITTSWVQYAALNYQGKNIHGEYLLSKWKLGSGDYIFKIEAWADDSNKDQREDTIPRRNPKFFIWLK